MQGRTLERQHQREMYSFDQAELPTMIVQALVRTIPDLVVQPKTVQDVKEILQYALRKRLPVVPRGCASSALGGAVPVKGGIALDLSTLNEIIEVNPERACVTVESGVRWKQLDEALEKYGLTLKTYPSSWFSTVGGWVSTGGYGINSLKFGGVKECVKSIEVVTPQGEVRRLTPADPYFHALFGTEGQMGIITKVTLEVRRRQKYPRVKFLQLPDENAAITFIHHMVGTKVKPTHIIYLDPQFMHHVGQLLGREVIEKPSLLIALEGAEEAKVYQQVKEAFKDVEEAPEYLAGYLWHERLFPMKVARLGHGLLGCEIVLPLSVIHSFLQSARELGRRMHAEVSSEIHVVADDLGLVICTWLSDSRRFLVRILHLILVLSLQRLGIRYGGRIYGVGYWNTPLVRNLFSENDTSQLKRVKMMVDPHRILNPGKFFELRGGGLLRLLFNSGLMRLLPRLMATSGPALRLLMRLEDRWMKRSSSTALVEAVYGCVRCGACVSICPAYFVTSDETVTGRGKLFIARKLLEGSDVGREEAQKLFLCVHCRGCQDVCQSGSRLLDAWDELEEIVENRFGKPTEEIARFVEAVDANAEYQRLLDEGVIVKPPEQKVMG